MKDIYHINSNKGLPIQDVERDLGKMLAQCSHVKKSPDQSP